MKTAETKSASHQSHNTAAKSFFNQGQEQSFFSEQSSDRTSFFPSTAQSGIQFKSIAGETPFFSPSPAALQAKCATCEADEKKQEDKIAETSQIQMMPAFSSAGDSGEADDTNTEHLPVQFSLTVGQPSDKYEQEADATADRVMTMPEPGAIGVGNSPKPLEIQRLSLSSSKKVQQQPLEEDGTVQAQEQNGQAPAATSTLEERLSASKGKGEPLPKETRGFMESRFGQDFSSVRVHTGSEAAQMNQDLGAQAFTHKQDVYFGAGKYQPESPSGKRLLAHELTHTVQQGKTSPSVQRLEFSDIKYTMPFYWQYRMTRWAGQKAWNAGEWMGDQAYSAGVSLTQSWMGGRDDIYDIRGKQTFSPTNRMWIYILGYFEKYRTNRVPIKIKYGSLGFGTILVEADDQYQFSTTGKFLLAIDHPGLQVNQAEKAIALEVEFNDNKIYGSIGVPKIRTGLNLKQNRDIPQISYGGFDPEALYPVIFGEAYTGDNFAVYTLDNGLQSGFIRYYVVGILDVQHQQNLIGGLVVVDDLYSWKGDILTRIIGTDSYQLPIERTPTGYLSGESQDLKLDGKWTGAGFTVSGGLHIIFANKAIEVTGTATYQSDRAQGSVTIAILPETKAQEVFRQHIPIQPCPPCGAATEEKAPSASPPTAPTNPAPINPAPTSSASATPAKDDLTNEPLALTAWGNAQFKLIDKAKTLGGEGAFVVSPEGYVITAGQLKLQKDFVLMDAVKKDPPYKLFEGEIATQIMIGVVPVRLRLSGDIQAGYQIGPIMMYELTVSGGYSNHPEHGSELCLGAKFEMPANLYAALNLVAAVNTTADFKLFEATLIEGAATLTARADLNAYLNAQPSIGVKLAQGKAPEYCLAGKLSVGGDMTVNLNVGLEISVFKKVKTKEGDLENKEVGKKDSFGSWTLGDFGFELDVNYILGSGETPEFSYAGKKFDSNAFKQALKKRKPAPEGEPKLRGGFTQDGEQRGVVDDESIKDREVDESNNPLGPFELVQNLTMNGTPHKLYLVVAGTESAPTAKIEMESNRENLLANIDEEILSIQMALASAHLNFSDKEIAKLQSRLKRQERLRAKTAQVTQSVVQNIADPELPTDIAAPGFETLDDEIGDYGDQFGVSDLGIPSAPAPGPVTPVPDAPPPGEQIRLVLPPQKAIYLSLYRKMIQDGLLQHSTDREARDTNQQATWDGIITAAMPRGTYCQGRGLSLEPVDILRPYWSKRFLDASRRSRWSKRFLDASRRSRAKPKEIDPDKIPRMQVDHVIEWQVRPLEEGRWVDQPWNYELMDQASNGSSGKKMESNIKRERKRLRDLTSDDGWLTQDITFTEVRTEGSAEVERWSEEAIKDGDHLGAYSKHTAEPIDKEKEKTC